MLNISMNDLFICLKGIILIVFVWLIDFFMVGVISLSMISPEIKDFFAESKDIINWVISISVLYATFLKIRNEKRKEK